MVVLDRLLELTLQLERERDSCEHRRAARTQSVSLLESVEGSVVDTALQERMTKVRAKRLVRRTGELQRLQQEVARFAVILAVERHYADLIIDVGVSWHENPRTLQALLGQLQGVGPDVLHSDKEPGEVGPGEEPARGPVGGEGLVAFIVVSEGVAIRDP